MDMFTNKLNHIYYNNNKYFISQICLLKRDYFLTNINYFIVSSHNNIFHHEGSLQSLTQFF